MKEQIIQALKEHISQDDLCKIGIHDICHCSGRPECHNCYQPFNYENTLEDDIETLIEYLKDK